MGYDRGRRDQKDSKYLRLTGLWESRNKRGMWSGKIRGQDLGKVMDKLQEADDARADVVVFLWENNEKRGQKDPDFSVQIAVAEEQGRGGRGGNYSRGGRDDGGSSDRNRRSREDERDSDNREDERDGRGEDAQSSGSDDDGGENESEREEQRDRPKSEARSSRGDGGSSRSSSRGSVKDKGKNKAPAKGKASKKDGW